MLVYEKKVEGERHLYGTLSSIPSDSDQRLIYKDENGDTIQPTLSDGFKDDGHGGIKDIEQDCKVNVFIGETCVIPPNYVAAESHSAPETFSFKIGSDTYEAEPDMTFEQWVQSAYNTDGYKVVGTAEPVVTSNESQFIQLNDTPVQPTDVIVQDTVYTLQDCTV